MTAEQLEAIRLWKEEQARREAAVKAKILYEKQKKARANWRIQTFTDFVGGQHVDGYWTMD